MIYPDHHGLFAFPMPNPTTTHERKAADASPGAPLRGPGGLLGNLGSGRKRTKQDDTDLNRRERRLLARVASGKTPPRMGRLISLGLIREQGSGFILTPAGKLAATAKAGEKVEVVGNLCRVGGQFAPCDASAEDEPTEEKPEASGGGATAEPAAEPTPESERPTIDPEAPPPEGADATSDFLKGLGLDPKLSDALGEYIAAQNSDEPEDIALNKDAAAALAAMGLIKIAPGQEGSSNVTIELTGAGRNLDKSIGKADIAKAMSAVERGHKRAEARAKRDAERAAKRQAREEARAAKRAEREAKRAAREAARSTKAMRPSRRKVWNAAYAEAKSLGLPLEARRKAARAALLRDTIASARKRYGRAVGALSVFKDAKGCERWLSITTTAYEDRDKEWISRKGIAGAVALGDASGERGPLRFWHVPGLDFGDCDYQATAHDGRVLVESGTFRSPAHAAVVKEAASRGYRMSPGFTHPAREPRGGVYDHIALFERSFLPADRASNPYTALMTTQENPMLTAEKRKELVNLVGAEKAAAFLGAVEATDKAAGERTTYKEQTVYQLPDGTPGVIADGVFVALKQATVKAEMSPAAMMQAGATEVLDAEEREESGADEEAEELEVMDMTASDLRGLIVEAIQSVMGGSPSDYASKMAEMKAQYEEMGKAFTSMKEAKGTDADALAALRSQFTAFETRIKELEGDLPAHIRHRDPDPVTPLALPDGVQQAMKQSNASPAEAAYKMIYGEAPAFPIQ